MSHQPPRQVNGVVELNRSAVVFVFFSALQAGSKDGWLLKSVAAPADKACPGPVAAQALVVIKGFVQKEELLGVDAVSLELAAELFQSMAIEAAAEESLKVDGAPDRVPPRRCRAAER